MTGLVPFADRILRPVLDRQTAARASIVGCCMIDMNGFLPTHISERSQPQGEDEEENHLYSRNRCIFMDSSTRAAMEIGKASCRARVCQSGENPVVAAT